MCPNNSHFQHILLPASSESRTSGIGALDAKGISRFTLQDRYIQIWYMTANLFSYYKLWRFYQDLWSPPSLQVDLFAVDLIMIPIHLGMHWCLAAIDMRAKTITYYDSLLGDNHQCTNALRYVFRILASASQLLCSTATIEAVFALNGTILHYHPTTSKIV